jgi:non-heme chloroperoxidase
MDDQAHPAPRTPLLLVHGTHAGAWMYERWLPWFEARGHRCVAIDLPGHAGAPLPAGATLGKIGFDAYVDSAHEAANALGRPIVIGHSLGGLVAQALAERDAVRGAVLVSPAPPRGIPVIGVRMLRYQLRDLPAVLLARALHPSWPTMRDLVLNRVPPAERRALFERLGPESGTVSAS